MNNYLKIVGILAVIAAVVYGALVFDLGRTPTVKDFITCVAANNAVMESSPRQCLDEKTGVTYTEEPEVAVPVDAVSVNTDNLSGIVAGPLVITGQALGTWYFEGSFPVIIVSPDGAELGRGIAQAQGDWMTTDFVPFSAEVVVDPRGNEEGVLRLSKDNPSGLAELDAHIDVPVTFSLEE